MNDLIKKRNELISEMDELTEMEGDLINVKSGMTMSALGVLLQKFNSSIDDLLALVANKDNYDTNLSGAIEKAISIVADKFSNIQPPQVQVTPTINFDVKPLQPFLQPFLVDIGKQNDTIIKLINKFENGQSEELYKLLMIVVNKQNAFLEKNLGQFDYTKQLSGIEESLNKRVEKLVVHRGLENLISEVVPIYKK